MGVCWSKSTTQIIPQNPIQTIEIAPDTSEEIKEEDVVSIDLEEPRYMVSFVNTFNKNTMIY